MHVIKAEATRAAEFSDFSHGHAPATVMTRAPAKPAAAEPTE